MSLATWGQSLVVGALVLPVVGLEKALRERRHRHKTDREADIARGDLRGHP